MQQVSGLVERLSEPPYNGRADLPHLADEENLVMDDLFPLIELMQLLGWANVSGGDIELTVSGRSYAAADMLPRKQMFADALIKHVPLAAQIRRVLDERPGHRAPAARFLRELEDHLSEEEAERVLETVINWGRHAEILLRFRRRVLSLRFLTGPEPTLAVSCHGSPAESAWYSIVTAMTRRRTPAIAACS